MKKYFFTIVLILLLLPSVWADNFKYKNIKEKSKVTYNQTLNTWSDKVSRGEDFFMKSISEDGHSQYLKDGSELYTGCDYEFIEGGKFIGFSNADLKFYDFEFKNGEFLKTPLKLEEVQKLFPNYKLITFSEFSKNTNSLKLKKNFGKLNLMLLSEDDTNFEGYSFKSGNSKFSTCPIPSALTIEKKGMIQFSRDGENSSSTPWYVILVR